MTVTSLTSASAKSSLHRGLPPACCLGHWEATACIYLVDSGGAFLPRQPAAPGPRQACARHCATQCAHSPNFHRTFFQCRARVVRVSALHYATREKNRPANPGETSRLSASFRQADLSLSRRLGAPEYVRLGAPEYVLLRVRLAQAGSRVMDGIMDLTTLVATSIRAL